MENGCRRVRPARGGRAWAWVLSTSGRKGIKQGSFHELTRFLRMRKKQIRARRKKKHLLFSKLSVTGQMGCWGFNSSAVAFGTHNSGSNGNTVLHPPKGEMGVGRGEKLAQGVTES